MTEIAPLTAFGTGIFIFTGYLLSRVFKRNDVADVMWGLGFLIIALLQSWAGIQEGGLNFKSNFFLFLLTVWSLRLSGHLFWRLKNTSEDPRYAAWRKDWGKREPIAAFFKVFVLQGILMAAISYPVSLAIRQSGEVLPLDFLGLCLFLFGFIFETTADAQLSAFKNDSSNKGKVLKTGVWGLSRHPNYFGEILIWWGLYLFAAPLPGGLIAALSPLLLTFLIIKVSGVAMLEKSMAKKGKEYQDYAASVPALLPLTKRRLWIFAKALGIVLLLDGLWLGVGMSGFYVEQTKHLARVSGGGFEALFWAAALVYFFIPFGVSFFAASTAKTRIEAGFKGALFGLALYAVYDFTNLALIKDWPYEMSLVDIPWGAALCCAAAVGSFTTSKKRT